MAEAARRLGKPAGQPAPLLARPLAPPEPEWRQLELEQLLYFVANPSRYLLQQRLGVRLEPGEGELETRDPFGLDYFPGQELAETLVEQVRAGQPPERLEARWQASGRLPQGSLGARLFARQAGEASAFSSALEAACPDRPEQALAIDLTLGGLRLVGTLPGVRPDGLFGFSVHKIWDGQLIAFWLRHLALNALAPPGVEAASRWLDPERLYRFAPRADAQALLAQWLAAYWQGLSQPLPLFPKSSLAYARALAKGKPAEDGRKVAEGGWTKGYNRPPEGANAYYRLAFPQGVSFEGEFERLSQALLLPMLQTLGEAD